MNDPQPNRQRTIAWIFGLLIVAIGSGCASLGKVAVKQTPISATKYPVAVRLVLDEEFRGYRDKRHTLEWPFGPALVDYARNSTESAFDRVIVTDSASAATEASGSSVAILHPRVARLNQLLPGFSWQDREILMVVEWTMSDPQTHRTLWTQSIEGTAVELGGSPITGARHEKVLFQKLFDDLNRKTVDAFMESSEMRRIGNSRTQQ